MKHKSNVSLTVESLERKYRALPKKLREKVDILLKGRSSRDGFTRRVLFQEALDVVERAMKCKHSCCRNLSRKERMANI